MDKPTIHILSQKASILKMEGDLVYDYNPLRVFRINNPKQDYF